MQQTGTITSVMPRLENGMPVTFTTTNGTFYKFDMTVNTQAGPITGEINSKSPQYPKNPGEQIVIEITSDPQYGNKFKAVNPQYANQPPAQVSPVPAQPAYTPPPPQTPPRDVQDEIRFAQGLNRACEEYNHDKIAEPSIELRTLMYYEILKTRVFPAALSSTSNIFDTPAADDDIPI